jgi:hypothetical protein
MHPHIYAYALLGATQTTVVALLFGWYLLRCRQFRAVIGAIGIVVANAIKGRCYFLMAISAIGEMANIEGS